MNGSNIISSKEERLASPSDMLPSKITECHNGTQ